MIYITISIIKIFLRKDITLTQDNMHNTLTVITYIYCNFEIV